VIANSSAAQTIPAILKIENGLTLMITTDSFFGLS
jgi:hypothetical protein